MRITYQSLFRLFPRLCAMTGTALTEAAEFEEIYGLRCTGVPTARPNVRRDYPDVVYKTEEAKLNAIVEVRGLGGGVESMGWERVINQIRCLKKRGP